MDEPQPFGSLEESIAVAKGNMSKCPVMSLLAIELFEMGWMAVQLHNGTGAVILVREFCCHALGGGGTEAAADHKAFE